MFKKIKLYFKKIKRLKKIKKLKAKIPPYVQKDFEVELNYKLWSTKGSRFAASRRNEILHRLSSQSVGYLSSYLIIVGLVNICNLKFWMFELDDAEINFISLTFSVLILLFSQLEASENFNLKSEQFHNCALDIAELYNKLRFTKTYESNNSDKKKLLSHISDEYDKVLKRYENHKQIDYLKFQILKPDYYELSNLKILKIKVEYYWRIHFKYHLFMYGPLLFFLIINIYKIFIKG